MRVTVVVRDSASQARIAGARVSVDSDGQALAESDASGVATLSLVAQSIHVARLGFRPVRVAIDPFAGETTFVNLPGIAQVLEGVRVAGAEAVAPPRYAEFDQRRMSGRIGSYLTSEQIDRRRPVRVTDLFRGLSGVRVTDNGSTKVVISARSQLPDLRNPGSGGLKMCLLRVAVDGQLREVGFSLDLLDPTEIYGIEVYNGPSTVPAKFSSADRDSWCGLIVIWTRSR